MFLRFLGTVQQDDRWYGVFADEDMIQGDMEAVRTGLLKTSTLLRTLRLREGVFVLRKDEVWSARKKFQKFLASHEGRPDGLESEGTK